MRKSRIIRMCFSISRVTKMIRIARFFMEIHTIMIVILVVCDYKVMRVMAFLMIFLLLVLDLYSVHLKRRVLIEMRFVSYFISFAQNYNSDDSTKIAVTEKNFSLLSSSWSWLEKYLSIWHTFKWTFKNFKSLDLI